MIRALVFVLSVLPAMAFAQCTSQGFETLMSTEDLAELHATSNATPFGTGLYWSATKGGVELAIMGTMHLPDARHDLLRTRAAPDLQRADLLLVEATLQDQSAMQTHMARNPDMMTITTGPTLPEMMEDATWARVRDAAQSRGVPGFMAAKMQPWFLSLTLAIPPCALSAIMTGQGGLDDGLMEDAAALNLPIAALEPWQDMLALLASGTFEEQIEALEFAVMAPDVQDALISTLITSYFAENSAYAVHVGRYAIDHMPDIDPAVFEAQWIALEQDLLNARNQNWIPVINDAAQTHDMIFVAFGAAHLIGHQGVLRLLERDGWTITRR